VKLLRHGDRGRERPGLLGGDGQIRDLSGRIDDITPDVLDSDRIEALAKIDLAALPLVPQPARLGPPVAGVGKIIAVGFNYAVHANEIKQELPKEPLLFSKAITSLSGPNDPVVLPKGSLKTDWEVELAVVIGRRALYVEQSGALDHVAGYSIMNDVSERAYQFEGTGQFVKGKSFDSFAPFGPWLVTRDEVPDPQRLRLWTEVNGTRRQDGTTADMIFGVAFLVSYISRFMTLMPGDVIATGTPPGVGYGHKPPIFLQPGDAMRLGIDGLGKQNQKVMGWSGQACS
jgi:2-keto-4-pentenoate hydratase/2-oxohepta-3-ene-1,7-dioic acid hydratase in catechol pathway